MMNDIAWKDFFAEHETKLAESESTRFDDNTLTNESSWLSHLASRAVLKVCGEDASTFLHGQFSNDLKQLNSKQWQLSSYSTPKGRLLAVFRIAKLNDDYYLEMPADIIEAFQKRLQMFIMRSAVTLENLSHNLVICGLAGTDLKAPLKAMGIETPDEVYGFASTVAQDVLLMREYGTTPRYVVLAKPQRMIELWQKLDDSVLQTTENTWSLSQIQQGQPDVFESTREQFVAQMMNLHVLGAVNFKKGCYPGQEVVARLQYLGKLKRRMYRFSAKSQTLPLAGSEVIQEEGADASGKVVSAAFSSADTIELLAVMKVASIESGDTLTLASGESLALRNLPYSFAEDS